MRRFPRWNSSKRVNGGIFFDNKSVVCEGTGIEFEFVSSTRFEELEGHFDGV